MALGMGGLGFTYDFTALYNNPALLGPFTFSVTGIGYQNRYGDSMDMEDNLRNFLDIYRSKGPNDSYSEAELDNLKNVANERAAIHGFNAKIPAMIIKNFAIGVSRVESAFLVPDFSAEEVVSDGVDSLALKSIGMKYTQYSFAYGMSLGKDLFFGVTTHFMTGKVNAKRHSFSDPLFSNGPESRDYVEFLVDACEYGFSKLYFTLGFSYKIGETLDLALATENVGSPAIKISDADDDRIELSQRYRAALAFRPAVDWGFYIDADLKKSPVFPGLDYNRQPLSFGIEKGFFQNTTFLRLGLNTDISNKYIIGEKSSLVLSMGIGIRVASFLVDGGLILNKNGSINGLAIAGYYVVN